MLTTATIVDFLDREGVLEQLMVELPDVGDIDDTESVYQLAYDTMMRDDGEWMFSDNPRLRDWLDEVGIRLEQDAPRESRTPPDQAGRPIEPHCAWYCPIHFFGHGWGIYLREECILSIGLSIASALSPQEVIAAGLSRPQLGLYLLRAAFYVLFLHEQFHHKVESFGLRVHVSTQSSKYVPYKKSVYQPTWPSADCLEEGLANADSYLRLTEPRYRRRIGPVLRATQSYLRHSFASQPPAYRNGLRYLAQRTFNHGLYRLQAQVLEGVLTPTMKSTDWVIAPRMTQSLFPVTSNIWVVVPRGVHPILPIGAVSPGFTASTRDVVGALERHYGYAQAPGGKGSHVKLKHPRRKTVVIPGNRRTLSPGAISHVLSALGDYSLSNLREFLEGTLPH